MSRPVIFLDIDGVLNNHRMTESGYCGIDSDKVSHLNELLESFDADLVVHSAWRYLVHNGSMTLEGFANMLCTHGVNLYRGMKDIRLIAVTRPDRAGGSEDDRAEQIKAFVDEHGIQHWIALDDLELPLPKDHFVHVQGSKGLTEVFAAEAQAKLGKQTLGHTKPPAHQRQDAPGEGK